MNRYKIVYENSQANCEKYKTCHGFHVVVKNEVLFPQLANFGGHIRFTSVRNQRNNAMYVLRLEWIQGDGFQIKSAFLRVKAGGERQKERRSAGS